MKTILFFIVIDIFSFACLHSVGFDTGHALVGVLVLVNGFFGVCALLGNWIYDLLRDVFGLFSERKEVR